MAANPHLDKNDQRALDAARIRFTQLSNSLSSFHSSLLHNQELIPWPNQQTQFSILSSNLESLSKTLSQNFPTYPPTNQPQPAQSQYGRPPPSSTNQQQAQQQEVLLTYPNTTFPAREHETMIGMLLRKKHLPAIEEWEQSGKQLALQSQSSGWLNEADTSTLWNNAIEVLRELGEERDWDDAYTKEEREDGIENVVTGLRPEMMEIGSLDEKGKRKVGGSGSGAEKVEGGLKIESYYKFWSTGVVPPAYGR